MNLTGHAGDYSLTVEWSSSANAYKTSGTYTCRAKRLKNDSIEERVWKVNKMTSNGGVHYRSEGESVEFGCNAGAWYPAVMKWYKYDEEINPNNSDTGIILRGEGDMLYDFSIPVITTEHEGNYLCVTVFNGSTEIQTEHVLKIKGSCDGGADIRFFQSLLPDVKSMSAYQKRYMRKKVLEAIDDALKLKEELELN